MPKSVTFEPGIQYVLHGIGYEVRKILSDGTAIVKNLKTQKLHSQPLPALWTYWEENTLEFVIDGEKSATHPRGCIPNHLRICRFQEHSKGTSNRDVAPIPPSFNQASPFHPHREPSRALSNALSPFIPLQKKHKNEEVSPYPLACTLARRKSRGRIHENKSNLQVQGKNLHQRNLYRRRRANYEQNTIRNFLQVHPHHAQFNDGSHASRRATIYAASYRPIIDGAARNARWHLQLKNWSTRLSTSSILMI